MTSLSDKKPWNTVHKPMLPKPSSYTTFSKKSQSESQRLEEENQKMEERLNAFKNYLKSEKDKRLNVNKIWSGGESNKGSLSNYAQNVLEKKKSLKKDITKISYLKNDRQLLNSGQSPKPPSVPKTNNDAHQSTDMVLSTFSDLKWRIPSSLGRYTKTPPKKTYAERINSLSSFQKSKRAVAIAADQNSKPVSDFTNSSESLLQGNYDEMESHKSFQKALAEWRGENTDSEPRLESPITLNLQSGSTQTANEVIQTSTESLKDLEKHVEKLLMDSSSLSYMDKILLSKLRASTEDEIINDDLNVSSIMEETPPSELINDLHDVSLENDISRECIPPKFLEIISIEELDYDDCFMGDEVLDSKQIIIEEPTE